MSHSEDEPRESFKENTPKETLDFRQALLASVDELIKYGKLFQEEKSNPQMTMFSNEIEKPKLPTYDLSEEQLISLARKEKELTGMYLAYNPFDKYIFVRLGCNPVTWEQLRHKEKDATGYVLDYIEEVSFNKGRFELNLELGGLMYEYKIKDLDHYKHHICLFRVEWNYSTKRIKIEKIRKCMELEQEWRGLFKNVVIKIPKKHVVSAYEYYKKQSGHMPGEPSYTVTMLVVLEKGDVLKKVLSPKNFTKEDFLYYEKLGKVWVKR